MKKFRVVELTGVINGEKRYGIQSNYYIEKRFLFKKNYNIECWQAVNYDYITLEEAIEAKRLLEIAYQDCIIRIIT